MAAVLSSPAPTAWVTTFCSITSIASERPAADQLTTKRQALDKVAEHNKQMWERLAKAGMNYTRPFGRPSRTKTGMRRFMDPRHRLKGVRLDGARVLGLAAGGGWDPIIFAKLGGDVTVFDISPTQLKTVKELAARERVKVRLVRCNMKDLSVFKDASFDVVWHCHSLVFVDDATRVLKE